MDGWMIGRKPRIIRTTYAEHEVEYAGAQPPVSPALSLHGSPKSR